jgi:hypothetical protein
MRRYFSELFTEVNTLFKLVPRPLTAAMIARAIPAAINPYSNGSGARLIIPKIQKRTLHVMLPDYVPGTTG